MRFLEELKRRNVLRTAAAYLVSAWLIVQIVETILPAFGFGDMAVRYVVIALAVLFLPALGLAWAFEITPEGLKTDGEVDRSRPRTSGATRAIDRYIILALAFAVSFFAIDKFVLDPERDAKELASAREAALSEVAGHVASDRSIAVLPFADMSPTGDQAYFSDGISEELLNLLARLKELRVISRSSAFTFRGEQFTVPEIATKLNVRYVLEGSVRKAGDQVRITAQLIDARDDRHLWSETYDRAFKNIFDIQDEISARVVERIVGSLLPSPQRSRAPDPAAYALFLKARHQRRLGTQESYAAAIESYQEALAIDSNYPQAWNELATVYRNQATLGLRPSVEGFSLAREAAEAALQVDPGYAPAHISLGWLTLFLDGDPVAAAPHYQRALDLAPGDTGVLASTALLLQELGREADAVAPIEYMVSRDPLSPAGRYTLAGAYILVGRYDEAIAQAEKVLELSPGFSAASYRKGVALLKSGRIDSAAEAFRNESYEPFKLVGLSLLAGDLAGESELTEDSDNALASLLEKFGDTWPYNIAYVYAWRREADRVFEWLERALEIKDSGLAEIASESLFERIHDDPRWLSFLRRLNKAPEQLADIQLEVRIPD